MDKRAGITWLVFVGALALIVFSIWVTNRSDQESNEPSSSETVSDRPDSDAATGGDVPAEESVPSALPADIDRVITDIQATMNEDEAVLDEEVSGETVQVREGGTVIDELEKSYDEFN